MLQRAGVPPRVIMELMRHSDLRLSSTVYTDTTCLNLGAEMEKLNAFLPSPLASPKADKLRLEEGKPVQTDAAPLAVETVAFSSHGSDLANLVPSWEKRKLAEREGFEPPVPLRARLISSQVR